MVFGFFACCIIRIQRRRLVRLYGKPTLPGLYVKVMENNAIASAAMGATVHLRDDIGLLLTIRLLRR